MPWSFNLGGDGVVDQCCAESQELLSNITAGTVVFGVRTRCCTFELSLEQSLNRGSQDSFGANVMSSSSCQ